MNEDECSPDFRFVELMRKFANERQRWQGKGRELRGFLRAQKAILKMGDLDS